MTKGFFTSEFVLALFFMILVVINKPLGLELDIKEIISILLSVLGYTGVRYSLKAKGNGGDLK